MEKKYKSPEDVIQSIFSYLYLKYDKAEEYDCVTGTIKIPKTEMTDFETDAMVCALLLGKSLKQSKIHYDTYKRFLAQLEEFKKIEELKSLAEQMEDVIENDLVIYN